VKEIVESLELVVKNNENIVVASTSESKKNLQREVMGEKLDRMNRKERKELAESFKGTDRILYDKILESKYSIDDYLDEKGLNFFEAIVGKMVISNMEKVKMRNEKFFSIPEVREIIAKSQKEHNKVIEGAKNYIIRMEGEKEKLEKSKQEAIEAGKKEANEELNKEKTTHQKEINNLTTSQAKEKEEIKKTFETEKEKLAREKEELNEKLTNFLNKEQE
jgi:hypothetical protein